MRLRRLFGSAALALVVVGACALPDYTFETSGAGGTLGDMGVTGDITVTGSGGVTSTGSTSSEAGSLDSGTSTTTTGLGGSEGGGGSAGDNPGGSAGEGVDAGTDVGGAGGTGGGTGGSGGGGATGGGGTGGSTATTGSGGTGGSGQCNNDTQCLSKQCDDMQCRSEHCGSGELDGNETDVDCGGPDCRPCGYDQECQQNSDCATADCSSQGKCESPLTVSCRCATSGACIENPQSIVVDMMFQNTTNTRIYLDGLTFHYYYSAEGSGVDQVRCIWANFSNSNCNSGFDAEVLTTGYDDTRASHEVSFEYTQGYLDGNMMSGSVQIEIHSNGPYQRANDYSFQEAPATMSAPCEFIVVTNADGVPIWGIPPK